MIDFKRFVVKVCLIELKCGANLSMHISSEYLRFELNQVYFYYYGFEAYLSK